VGVFTWLLGCAAVLTPLHTHVWSALRVVALYCPISAVDALEPFVAALPDTCVYKAEWQSLLLYNRVRIARAASGSLAGHETLVRELNTAMLRWHHVESEPRSSTRRRAFRIPSVSNRALVAPLLPVGMDVVEDALSDIVAARGDVRCVSLDAFV